MILSTKQLSIGYKNTVLLQNITVTTSPGQLIAVLGLNGSGKSTLLKTLIGMIQPLKGDVYIDQHPIYKIPQKQRAQYISFTSTEKTLPYMMKVFDFVALGRYPYTNWLDKLRQQDIHFIEVALQQVGMLAFCNTKISHLSDGQFQKVVIARAVAQQATLMVFDEPSTFLDIKNKLEIFKLLRRLTQDNKITVILATHEIHEAIHYADRIWILEKDKTLLDKSSDTIESENILSYF